MRHHRVSGFRLATVISGTWFADGCVLCFRRTDEAVECTMPAALHTHADSVTVCVEFENVPCQSEELSTTYTYEKNPTIGSIHPTKSFLR